MTTQEIKQQIKNLDIDDELYIKKLDILFRLILHPRVGHIVHESIVEWCREVGLKPEASFEDGGAWWTCNAE